MNTLLRSSVRGVLDAHQASAKPLAVILAGHNGSGKSTMWNKHLSETFKIPLINADRMMMSILPERDGATRLPKWAQELRDEDKSWMQVAQRGVQAFVAQAMSNQVPFAMETVFSHWQETSDGKIQSKIDLIKDLQTAGYFVVLFFVGLSSKELSIARVQTRAAKGGHNVELGKLQSRFPRTQKAIKLALSVADASILTDNSSDESQAFTVVQVRMSKDIAFDCRNGNKPVKAITDWLDIVAPQG